MYFILSKHLLAQICFVLKLQVCSFSRSALSCCSCDAVPVMFIFLAEIISSTDFLSEEHCSLHILFTPELL